MSNSPAAGRDATRPPSSQSTNDVHAARQLLADTHGNENSARQHLADLDRHQKTRATELAATATQRHALSHDIGQLDTALHHTRIDRVLRPRRPSHPAAPRRPRTGTHRYRRSSRLVSPSKPTRTPPRPHHPDDATWQRLVDDLSVTPTLAHIADRHIAIQHHHQLRPTDWASHHPARSRDPRRDRRTHPTRPTTRTRNRPGPLTSGSPARSIRRSRRHECCSPSINSVR